MQAQRYRQRIDIQQQIETQDSETGDITVAWQTLHANLPAEVLLGPGKQFVAANAKQSEVTARINLYWFAGLTQKMRIVWEGKVFDLDEIAADPSNRREYRLRCIDGLTNGA